MELPVLSSMSAQAASLAPDEVAMVLGTMIVVNKQCGLKGNEFPLNVAVAKLGQDLVDFMSDNRYAPSLKSR